MSLNQIVTQNLSSSQANTILNIKYPGSNTSIINDSNLDIVYQILGLLKRVGYDETVGLMQGQSILTSQQLYKNSLILRDEGKTGTPTFTKSDIDEAIMYGASTYNEVNRIYLDNAKILREPTLVNKGAVDCVKCGSDKTSSTVKQTRAADESASVFNRCQACGFKWRIG